MTDAESNPSQKSGREIKTIGRLDIALQPCVVLKWLLTFYSLLICVYMSTRCQHNVMDLSRPFILGGVIA